MKILVVDDDLILLEYMKIYLNKNDISVDTESIPEKALAMIKIQKYDLVITDYSMPFMNGLQLLIKIKEYDSEQLVIMHTGSCDEDVKEKAVNIGIYGFFSKPAFGSLEKEIYYLRNKYAIKRL